MSEISAKVTAASAGAAVATIIWTVVATLAPGLFSDTAIVSLTGATGTVVAFVLGYLQPDDRSRAVLMPEKRGRNGDESKSPPRRARVPGRRTLNGDR